MIYKINFGHYKLAVKLNRKPGRPGKTIFQKLQNEFYSGRSLNHYLRRLLEAKKAKQILGLNLMAITLFSSVLAPVTTIPSASSEALLDAETQDMPITTNQSVGLPVNSFRITQGYHFFHQAIDFGEELGAPIYPIRDGVVEEIIYDRFAYGNHILIDHGSGFKSLYAHLAKVVVEKRTQVDRNTVIGTVGTSGWATGPHLHLEVYDNGRPFNPLTILK